MYPFESYDVARPRHIEMIQHAELKARLFADLPARRRRYRRPSLRLRERRQRRTTRLVPVTEFQRRATGEHHRSKHGLGAHVELAWPVAAVAGWMSCVRPRSRRTPR